MPVIVSHKPKRMFRIFYSNACNSIDALQEVKQKSWLIKFLRFAIGAAVLY